MRWDVRGRTKRLPRFSRTGTVTLWIDYRGDDAVQAERKKARFSVVRRSTASNRLRSQ